MIYVYIDMTLSVRDVSVYHALSLACPWSSRCMTAWGDLVYTCKRCWCIHVRYITHVYMGYIAHVYIGNHVYIGYISIAHRSTQACLTCTYDVCVCVLYIKKSCI